MARCLGGKVQDLVGDGKTPALKGKHSSTRKGKDVKGDFGRLS